ncbi:hypothetical protein Tco_0716493 [Tanacetum coccineum]
MVKTLGVVRVTDDGKHFYKQDVPDREWKASGILSGETKRCILWQRTKQSVDAAECASFASQAVAELASQWSDTQDFHQTTTNPPTNNNNNHSSVLFSNSKTQAQRVHDGQLLLKPVQRKPPGNVGRYKCSRRESDMFYKCIVKDMSKIVQRTKESTGNLSTSKRRCCSLMKQKRKGSYSLMRAEAIHLPSGMYCSLMINLCQMTTTKIFEVQSYEMHMISSRRG